MLSPYDIFRLSVHRLFTDNLRNNSIQYYTIAQRLFVIGCLLKVKLVIARRLRRIILYVLFPKRLKLTFEWPTMYFKGTIYTKYFIRKH